MQDSTANGEKTAPTAAAGEPVYQVLARKYRPRSLADLVGQEAMVRTLRNAFASGRIAQAFILTGIRGTGKTTTARIIAMGLNCTGADGAGGPTTEPCGRCEHCTAIMEGRHVDVLEMDAASRTGVGDIREIIDSVHYRAASARYKIYIIDEVHMLSTSAFNALLKTLEEPPPHVKFIFATTEIRKVPVTVLSRCQRFDLRRIEPEAMMAHLARIAQREGVEIAPEALALITRAAEGSMRDALSLMDQAIAHGGGGQVTAEGVRAMLGLADRARVLDLFEHIMRGDAAAALAELGAQYADGADPAAILRDLAEITHWLSVVKITPALLDDPALSPEERRRGGTLAEGLSQRVLGRTWQMLLKALEELPLAPNALMAAEMAIIRLTHVADLPPPEEILRRLRTIGSTPPAKGGPDAAGATAGGDNGTRRMTTASGAGGAGTAPTGGAAGRAGTGEPPTHPAGAEAAFPRVETVPGTASAGARTAWAASRPAPSAEAAPLAANHPLAGLERFEDLVALIRKKRDLRLLIDIESHLRLVAYSPGRIEFALTKDAPSDLPKTLAARLREWTGVQWMVSLVSEADTPTIAEARRATAEDLHALAMSHPLLQAVKTLFPEAEIRDVRPREDAILAALGAASGEAADGPLDGSSDPFEEPR